MTYKVLIERLARRTIEKIAQPHQDRVTHAIRNLRNDPRPPGVRKLVGRPVWRIRVGDYRILYEIDDSASTVLVVTLGPRGEVYRQAK